MIQNKLLACEVREKLRPALIAINALRNHPNPYWDTLQQAKSGKAVAEYMIARMKVKANEIEIQECLAYIVNNDRTVRGWHSSIGLGDGLDKWEWALPMDMVPE